MKIPLTYRPAFLQDMLFRMPELVSYIVDFLDIVTLIKLSECNKQYFGMPNSAAISGASLNQDSSSLLNDCSLWMRLCIRYHCENTVHQQFNHCSASDIEQLDSNKKREFITLASQCVILEYQTQESDSEDKPNQASYSVEVSRSNRAKCRSCHHSITDEHRGCMSFEDSYHEYMQNWFYHIGCFKTLLRAHKVKQREITGSKHLLRALIDPIYDEIREQLIAQRRSHALVCDSCWNLISAESCFVKEHCTDVNASPFHLCHDCFFSPPQVQGHVNHNVMDMITSAATLAIPVTPSFQLSCSTCEAKIKGALFVCQNCDQCYLCEKCFNDIDSSDHSSDSSNTCTESPHANHHFFLHGKVQSEQQDLDCSGDKKRKRISTNSEGSETLEPGPKKVSLFSMAEALGFDLIRE
ncbi:hypothetical protein C9374_012832 [Naegleria lovaniensis]|uniref:PARP-type domain-containing protein n=1 Tax=Naegleria lovaniensis TaxID=51637 RepID=A0AA88KBI6_NAELO|nr:uncharacterized protein C9374_012832 [Naegleria lovaniensis]KAG2373100.1 hypothetical protein C9374_012832 [Naegleria lovaniensis]